MKATLYAVAILGLGVVFIPYWMAGEILAGRWRGVSVVGDR